MPRNIISLFILWTVLCGSALAKDSGGIWIDVPFVQQEREGCGAAVISMVMQYWQQQAKLPMTAAADPDLILHALHSDAAHGVYASDMVSYFERNGYRAFAFTGERADLEHHLAQGRPLIVALKPGSGVPLHYVAVVGLDPEHRLVLLNDPAQRKLLKEDSARFEKEWKAAGYWTLLALPEANAR